MITYLEPPAKTKHKVVGGLEVYQTVAYVQHGTAGYMNL